MLQSIHRTGRGYYLFSIVNIPLGATKLHDMPSDNAGGFIHNECLICAAQIQMPCMLIHWTSWE
jgi:hypothetical protein